MSERKIETVLHRRMPVPEGTLMMLTAMCLFETAHLFGDKTAVIKLSYPPKTQVVRIPLQTLPRGGGRASLQKPSAALTHFDM
jgi:hypothetical protein